MGYQVFPAASAASGATESYGLYINTTYAGTPSSLDYTSGIATFYATTTLSVGVYTFARPDGGNEPIIGNTTVTNLNTTATQYFNVLTGATSFAVRPNVGWTSRSQVFPYTDQSYAIIVNIRQIGSVLYAAGIGSSDGVSDRRGSGLRISTNAGASWSAVNLVTSNRQGVDVWSDGTNVYAVDGNNRLYTATDRYTFNFTTNHQAGGMTFAMYDSSTGYHLGINGGDVSYLSISSNGLFWTSRGLANSMNPQGIKRVNNFLVTFGRSANLHVSTDALNWTRISSASYNTWTVTTNQNITDVHWESPWYFAATEFNNIYRSTNMTTWQQIHYGGNTSMNPGTTFLFSDADGAVYSAGGRITANSSTGFWRATNSSSGFTGIGAAFLGTTSGDNSVAFGVFYSSTAVNNRRFAIISLNNQRDYTTQGNLRISDFLWNNQGSLQGYWYNSPTWAGGIKAPVSITLSKVSGLEKLG